MPNLVARNHWHFRRNVQGFQCQSGARKSPTGSDGVWHSRFRQVRQQLFGAWKRPHLRGHPRVCRAVQFLQALRFVTGDVPASLPQQCVYEQAAAHANPPVDSPYRQADAAQFQRFPPGQHMLVNAIDQGAVKVE